VASYCEYNNELSGSEFVGQLSDFQLVMKAPAPRILLIIDIQSATRWIVGFYFTAFCALITTRPDQHRSPVQTETGTSTVYCAQQSRCPFYLMTETD
jgi:hypothetical protein